jgi:hypothetical protein
MEARSCVRECGNEVLTVRAIYRTAETVSAGWFGERAFTEILVLTQEGDDCNLSHRRIEIPLKEGRFRIEGGPRKVAEIASQS